MVTPQAREAGAAAGGDGVITVDGTGSASPLTGQLQVGDQGAGELSILAGATVNAAQVTSGNATLSSGNIDIEGAGSDSTAPARHSERRRRRAAAAC